RLKGDKKTGLDLISTGKNSFAHALKVQEYTEDSAPAEMAEIGRWVLRFGHMNTGILFQNVLTEDPYETLMDGVTECSYAGEEKVGSASAHHLTFKQAEFDWELWIASGDQPLVLKASSTRKNDEFKMVTVETYSNWKFNGPVDDKAFQFEAP